MSQKSEPKVSGADVILLVKESNDLLSSAMSEVDSVNQKLSSYEADSKSARDLITQAVDKLASINISGEPLIDAESKDAFIRGMQTKVGTADVLVKVIDKLAEQTTLHGKKVASLGEPKNPSSFVETGKPVSGFASLASSRTQM